MSQTPEVLTARSILPASTTESAPAAVVFHGLLHVIYRGLTQRLLIQSTGDGTQWTDPVELDGSVNSSDAPCAVVTPGPYVGADMPYVFYKGVVGDDKIYWTSFTEGRWLPATQLPPEVNTDVGPAAFGALNGNVVFYKGCGGDTNIYAVAAANGSPPPQKTGWMTDVGPAVLGGGSPPLVCYKNPDPESTISIQAWGDTVPEVTLPANINTSDSPDVVTNSAGCSINVFYRGVGADQQIYVAHSSIGSVGSQSSWTGTSLLSGVESSAGPRAVFFRGALYVVYKGPLGDSNIYTTAYAGGF